MVHCGGGGEEDGDLYGAKRAVTGGERERERGVKDLHTSGGKHMGKSQEQMRIIKFKYRHVEKAHWVGKELTEKREKREMVR